MALRPFLSSLIIVLHVILPSVTSIQNGCPENANSSPSVTENQALGVTVFGPILNITNLTLSENPGSYFAVIRTNTTPAVFNVSFVREVDSEVLRSSQITTTVLCLEVGAPQAYKYQLTIPVIGENEFAPQFTNKSYNAGVPENSLYGTTVFSFKGTTTDPDFSINSPVITYIISPSSPTPAPFIINDNIQGSVVVNGTLDFENGPRVYTLYINAMDGGKLTNQTTLEVTVMDQDDNGPVFNFSATYTLHIPEGNYDGGASTTSVFTTVPQIAAHDGDAFGATIAFELDPSSRSMSSTFTVLRNGSIKVTGAVTPGTKTFKARAYQVNGPSDRFTVASVQVTIDDINNNKPNMSSTHYQASVLESAGLGTVVMTVAATDLDQGDNGAFKFYIQETSIPFNISTDNGIGVVRVRTPLDREKRPSYRFHVFAQEDQSKEQFMSNISCVVVDVLDVNDNTPVFALQSYNFTIVDTLLQGNFVGNVTAIDMDIGQNGIIVYTLTAIEGIPSAFTIDQSTGSISLSRNLTPNDVGVVYLDVRASDNATGQDKRSDTVRVSVTVRKVNQYPPTFNELSYVFNVPETVPRDFILGIISATDPDNDPLTYTLQSNNLLIDGLFRLQGTPPYLMVNSTLDLDLTGSVSVHKFAVVVSDGLKTATASVTVSVAKVNEFTPTFVQSLYRTDVKETQSPGPLMQV